MGFCYEFFKLSELLGVVFFLYGRRRGGFGFRYRGRGSCLGRNVIGCSWEFGFGEGGRKRVYI